MNLKQKVWQWKSRFYSKLLSLPVVSFIHRREIEGLNRLFDQMPTQKPPTCLVVSHRRAALRKADQIVVLMDGRVEARGKLDDLLNGCEEMQRLWHGELVPDQPSKVYHVVQAVTGEQASRANGS